MNYSLKNDKDLHLVENGIIEYESKETYTINLHHRFRKIKVILSQTFFHETRVKVRAKTTKILIFYINLDRAGIKLFFKTLVDRFLKLMGNQCLLQ